MNAVLCLFPLVANLSFLEGGEERSLENKIINKQAGAELAQSQVKLEVGWVC